MNDALKERLNEGAQTSRVISPSATTSTAKLLGVAEGPPAA